MIEPEIWLDPTWRRLVLDAAREREDIDEFPEESSRNVEDWDLMSECLEANILWDTDFED